MRVGVEREAGVRVTQNPGQRFRVHAAGECVCCERMTKIMEANARQSRFLQQRFEPPVCRPRIHRQFRAGRLWKNPLADGGFLPRPQQRRNAFRQDDRAVALARFRVTEGVDALPLAVQRPGDFERPGLRVEVAPHERADLAAPQAGHKLRVEEIPPDIVLLNRLQERVQLLFVQYLHRLVV